MREMRREREKKKKKKTHFFSFFGKKKKNFETFQDVDHSKWSVGGHLGGQVQRTNGQVANVTTPANYFHLLRRQLHRSFRKPLVVMSPKNLLRHPAARSDLDEFDDEASDANIQGVRFKRLIMDSGATDRSADPPRSGPAPQFSEMTPRANRGVAREYDLSQPDREAMPCPLAQRLPPVVQREAIHREPAARRDRSLLTQLRAASTGATREGHALDRRVADLHPTAGKQLAIPTHVELRRAAHVDPFPDPLRSRRDPDRELRGQRLAAAGHVETWPQMLHRHPDRATQHRH